MFGSVLFLAGTQHISGSVKNSDDADLIRLDVVDGAVRFLDHLPNLIHVAFGHTTSGKGASAICRERRMRRSSIRKAYTQTS